MHSSIWHAALVAAALTLSTHAVAQTTPQTRLTGLIHDYTPSLDASGPWQVVGHWTLDANAANGKVRLLASLSMVRSENATRGAHTHHVQISDGQVTPLANGYRITGAASFTSNGSLAGFSGSPVDIEITSNGVVPFANFSIAFGGAAALHFGPQLKGVVTYEP